MQLDVGAESGAHWRHLKGTGQLVTVEGQAGLGARRVAGREAAGFDPQGLPGLQNGLPEGDGPVGVDKDLVADILAGVAGAGDDQVELLLGAAQLALDQAGLGHAGQGVLEPRVGCQALQDGQRCRPLQGQVDAHVGAVGRVLEIAQHGGALHAQVGALAVDQHLAVVDGIEPGPVLVGVGRVHHHQVEIVAAPVDHQVVDDPAVLIEEVSVKALAGLEPAGIVGQHQVQELGGVGAADLEHAHVGHVKEAGCLADGVVLVEDAGVPHRHLPPGKGDHLARVGLVPLVEGRAPELGVRVLIPLENGQLGTRSHRVEIVAPDKVGHS